VASRYSGTGRELSQFACKGGPVSGHTVKLRGDRSHLQPHQYPSEPTSLPARGWEFRNESSYRAQTYPRVIETHTSSASVPGPAPVRDALERTSPSRSLQAIEKLQATRAAYDLHWACTGRSSAGTAETIAWQYAIPLWSPSRAATRLIPMVSRMPGPP